jgi:hypothetical protein
MRRGVNFQVTVLKILVSYPDGFAVMEDLKRDMAILATSGPDWAERTRRLAKATQKHEPTLARFAVGMGGILSQSETVVRAFGRNRGLSSCCWPFWPACLYPRHKSG